MTVLEECISCGSCEPACPNQAITLGETIYVVDRDRCTECVGAADSPRCVEVCPVEGCIVVPPELVESRDVLMARYEVLHA
jgi:ferredoxin